MPGSLLPEAGASFYTKCSIYDTMGTRTCDIEKHNGHIGSIYLVMTLFCLICSFTCSKYVLIDSLQAREGKMKS